MKILELLGLPEHKNDELGREAIARVIEERGYSDEEIQNLYKIALKSLPMPCDIVSNRDHDSSYRFNQDVHNEREYDIWRVRVVKVNPMPDEGVEPSNYSDKFAVDQEA